MKKRIMCLLLLSLSIISAFSVSIGEKASEEYDLKDMSYDDLVRLQEQVNMEIVSRAEAAPVVFIKGLYKVGTSLPAGTYYFTCPTPYGSYSVLHILQSNKDQYDYFSIDLYYGSSRKVILEEGQYFEVKNNSAMACIRDFTVEDFEQYIPPKGALVPQGRYVIGSDIPAGTYNVFPATTEKSLILLFESEDDVPNAPEWWDSSDRYNIEFPKSPEDVDKGVTISFVEGQVIIVEDADIIMKTKTENQFVFKED